MSALHRHERFSHLVPWPIAALSPPLTLALFRAWSLDADRGKFTDCAGCFIWPALSSDLWIIAALAGLLALSAFLRGRWISVLLAALGSAILLVFAVDIMVTQMLTHRLHYVDVLRYGDETGAQFDMLSPFLARPTGIALALLAFSAIALFSVACLRVSRPVAHASSSARRRTGHVVPALLALLAAAGAWAGQGMHYLELSFYENVFLVNLRDTSWREHSPARLAELRSMRSPPAVCGPGEGHRPSVVLVVFESWSLYHSRLFSGLGDHTPRLDALAAKGAWYPEYYSNGFATETALIGLLNGQVPIPTHRAWGVLAFDTVDQDAHRRLAGLGYRTAFFTTGALTFDDRAGWAAQIGLQHVEGGEHPFYAGMPRGPFQAASDRALVDRFLGWYDNERPDAPFMATLLTVGTHPPFVDTDPGDPHEPGERAAFARADRELARLVEGLDARGFLRNGIVMIVGDHRAMTPMRDAEVERFGEDGLSRVPAFALGATGLPAGPVRGGFQHTDLLPSLLHRIDDRSCRNAWQGRMFGPAPEPAKVVVYEHPALRDELRVRVDGHVFRLKLDGDDTRWLGSAPHDGKAILAEVMRQRVSRDKW